MPNTKSMSDGCAFHVEGWGGAKNVLSMKGMPHGHTFHAQGVERVMLVRCQV